MNWVGGLGSGGSKQADRLAIKQLLGKAITDSEIRQLYPVEWTDGEAAFYIDAYKEEVSKGKPLIYVCRACGDPGCGGIRVQIDKTGDGVRWTFRDGVNQLAFTFEKYAYYHILNQYL